MSKINDETPTAERACFPQSPNTCTKRSEAPLITFGCSVNAGSELTIPSTFTVRFTLLRSPSSAFRRDIADKVEAELLIELERDVDRVLRVHQQQRVAVGRHTGHGFGCDVA